MFARLLKNLTLFTTVLHCTANFKRFVQNMIREPNRKLTYQKRSLDTDISKPLIGMRYIGCFYRFDEKNTLNRV
jgi:hypothetical protein